MTSDDFTPPYMYAGLAAEEAEARKRVASLVIKICKERIIRGDVVQGAAKVVLHEAGLDYSFGLAQMQQAQQASQMYLTRLGQQRSWWESFGLGLAGGVAGAVHPKYRP